MAFKANNISEIKLEEHSDDVPLIYLSKTEIEILLSMMKESHFKGEHLQQIYELVLKLQDYYAHLP
jgi:hypothetical protein